MSDVNGLLADVADSRSRIPVIENTADYHSLVVADDPNDEGTGGMLSKLQAADIANTAGVDMWVFDASTGSNRGGAVRGEIGTYFPARTTLL